MRCEVAGSPDVQSMKSEPRSTAARIPSGPSRSLATSGDVGRHVMMTLAPRTASAGVAATLARAVAVNSRARSVVRFQTRRSNPPLAMHRAMGRPIAPSPRKATVVIGVDENEADGSTRRAAEH